MTKIYSGVVANDNIRLGVAPGEVVGLLGENGAGKSTLIAILSGLTAPSRGLIEVGGRSFSPNSPADALREGIATAYQHGALVPTLSVDEQLHLANVEDDDTIRTLLREMDRSRTVRELSVGERQLLEIARAVGRTPRVLLLDEPTSTLEASQVEMLFDVIRQRRSAGRATVFVTHKLGEALAICDRIVVMRRGAVVDELRPTAGNWPAGTEDRLLGAMFGADPGAMTGNAAVTKRRPGAPAGNGSVVLSVGRVVDTGPAARHRPVGVSLTVRAGEIVAIAGIQGQGQRELGKVLAGYRPCRGAVSVNGTALSGKGAREFAGAGVGYLTGDRRGEGIVARMSITANLLLKRQREEGAQRFGILRARAIREAARREIAAWGIRPPDPGRPAGTLSGGNMQKVLLARELVREPVLLVADNPTHGLDVRSQVRVAEALRSVANRGGAVILLTADLDEALRLSDRVAVMNAGRLSPLGPTAAADRAELSRWMAVGW
ncbi:MAG TPA: ATP-binding cassette domain-containing protein [Thermomicrobiales bacterium]|nr:ATP-binding cassette domain-containing protein [Thermomicrobiales bacterium]